MVDDYSAFVAIPDKLISKFSFTMDDYSEWGRNLENCCDRYVVATMDIRLFRCPSSLNGTHGFDFPEIYIVCFFVQNWSVLVCFFGEKLVCFSLFFRGKIGLF